MQTRTDQLRILKSEHGLSTEQIARTLRKSAITVGQWLAPGVDREIPERELDALKSMLALGRIGGDRPDWVHMSAGGRPMATIENVERLLDFCGIDSRLLIDASGLGSVFGSEPRHNQLNCEIRRSYSVTMIHSKCTQFDLSISLSVVKAYLRELFNRATAGIEYDELGRICAELHGVSE